MTASPSAVLDAARVQAGMGAAELWLAYFALGGVESPGTVQAVLGGGATPSRPDSQERDGDGLPWRILPATTEPDAITAALAAANLAAGATAEAGPREMALSA